MANKKDTPEDNGDKRDELNKLILIIFKMFDTQYYQPLSARLYKVLDEYVETGKATER